MNTITEKNCKGNLWRSSVINGNGNCALAATLTVLPLQKDSFPMTAALGTLSASFTVPLGVVSPNSMGEHHHLYTTTFAALPFTLQSRSWLHKHPRISTCEGKVFMKQGNYATSLHLPLFLWALCSSSFLPSQENAVPVMEKCPTSTAHTGWVMEIGVSCFPSAWDRAWTAWKLWKPQQVGTLYREDWKCMEQGKRNDMTAKKFFLDM